MKKPAIPAATIDAILASVTGGAPVRRALRETQTDPKTFYRMIEADAALCQRYARAKLASVDALADEIMEIQDEEPPLRDPGGPSPGDPKSDPAWVTWQKNRVDSRKWLLSKLAPKKYGDKVELTGQDGGPFQVVIQGSDSGL